MSKKPQIFLNYLHSSVILKERDRLKKFLISMFKHEGKTAGTINIIFCTDDYLLEINKNFLKHNYYTDIITFDLSEISSTIINSDIYISYDRVKENALIHKVSIPKELHRVIFHGILHLCGFKDKTAKDIKIMRSKENQYLSQYFI
ncbi:MAG: rRNA maturation RNase YbeY [Sphingobacteriales bacterium]|nr:MAG: rRNA maturation RNase YbeY [Sphingobacteriales bacterium]